MKYLEFRIIDNIKGVNIPTSVPDLPDFSVRSLDFNIKDRSNKLSVAVKQQQQQQQEEKEKEEREDKIKQE